MSNIMRCVTALIPSQSHLLPFLRAYNLIRSEDMLKCLHMQIPTEYFLLVLGKHLKYSSCLYPAANTTLDEAEEAMLGVQLQPQALLKLKTSSYI